MSIRHEMEIKGRSLRAAGVYLVLSALDMVTHSQMAWKRVEKSGKRLNITASNSQILAYGSKNTAQQDKKLIYLIICLY